MTDATMNRLIDLLQTYGNIIFVFYVAYAIVFLAILIVATYLVIKHVSGNGKLFSLPGCKVTKIKKRVKEPTNDYARLRRI